MTSNLPTKEIDEAAEEAFRAADSISLLPASEFEAKAIDALDRMMSFIGVMFTTEAGHLMLRIYFRALIGAGTISRVIAAARSGNRDADRALREVAAEMLDRGVLPSTLLRTYAQDALLQPQVTYPQGRNIGDTWSRDLIIAGLVGAASRSWHLPKTRSHTSKKPNRLSACYLVAKALGRRRINLSERRVETIFNSQMKNAEALEQLSASLGPI